MTYKRVVVKIGTTSLTHSSGEINLEQIERLSWILSCIRAKGYEVILVSSGAIAAGKKRLGLATRPRDITMRQVASAVGQGALMQIYESCFNRIAQTTAQILLTKDVLTHPKMRENAINAINKLLELEVIPIVNENDTISTDELQGFSDNDNLAACVAELIQADALILLSDIDAMYDKNPSIHKDAKPIFKVFEISEQLLDAASGALSELGTGGMRSKVLAAQRLMQQGIDMFIVSGSDVEVIRRVLNNEEIGTHFVGNKDARNS